MQNEERALVPKPALVFFACLSRAVPYTLVGPSNGHNDLRVSAGPSSLGADSGR